ncbi:MAG: SDR family oxidoreductase [Myxococcota bacterium]
MSLVSMMKGRGPSGFGYGSTAEEVTEGLNLSGRTYVVTGANSGLGLETVRVLTMRGAKVFGLGRTAEKVAQATASFGANVEAVGCELSDPQSVRSAVTTLQGRGVQFDAIIANAGIMALPKLEKAFGYELQFFTNHIGHFLLVTGLLDKLSPTGRVVMLSSDAHTRAPRAGIQFDNLDGARGYSPWANYGQSKLANLLFARHLAKRLAGTQQTANALHPGVIATNLSRSSGGLVQTVLRLAEPIFLKSVGQGAATQVYVATHPSLGQVSGEYFADCNVAVSSRNGQDLALAERLWQESERIVASLP